MKRYYLSKIIKVTTDPSFPDGYYAHRFQIGYPNVDYQGGEIATDPVTGIPTQKALLIIVGAIDHKPFQNDPDLVPLPDVSIDVKVSSIHAPTKLTAKAAIAKLGFQSADVDAVWDNADGMRDVLNHYGQLNNTAFDANNFDLTDL